MVTKRPLLPKVTLTKNDASTYVFDPISGSPTYDFRLLSLTCSPAFDSNGGFFNMVIAAADGTNSAANTILTNISEGNEVLIAVGKTAATNVFRGVIEYINIIENSKNFMAIELSGPDWGSDILKHRVVNGAIVQAKAANGVDLDATDNAVLIQNIAQRLLGWDYNTLANERSWYPASDVSAIDQGITISSANFKSTGIRLPQFYANMEMLDDKLSELDAAAGTIHYVDVDKAFILKDPGDNSGAAATILLTDDTADSVASTWDTTKLGYIAPGASYKKSVEHHNRRIYGVGGDNLLLDQKQETDSASSPTFTGGAVQWLGMKFTPTQLQCEKIGVKLSKQGSPTADIIMTLIENNGTTPTGSTLKRLSKPPAAIGTTADWHYFTVTEELNTAKSYWVVIEGNGDASNYYKWHHDNLDTATSATSTNGSSWTLTSTPNRFGYTFRQYYTTPLLTTYPASGLASTDKHFHEYVIKRPDITQRQHMEIIVNNEATNMTRRKEIFKGRIYAPDTLLQTGQAVRIRKQASGFVVDDEFIIGQIEYVFEAGLNQLYYNIEAATFTTYA